MATDWYNLLISAVKEGMTFSSILNQRYEIIWDVASQNMFWRDSISFANIWNYLKK